MSNVCIKKPSKHKAYTATGNGGEQKWGHTSGFVK